MNQTNTPSITLHSPIMTMDKFAEESGLREGQIRSQLSRGNLPTYRVGRLVLVNNAMLLAEFAQLMIIPIMTYERFALLSGLREPQVLRQAENGSLPTKYIGRLRVIDIAALTHECLNSDFYADESGEAEEQE